MHVREALHLLARLDAVTRVLGARTHGVWGQRWR